MNGSQYVEAGTPLRILIVEDSEDDTLLLLRELRRGGYDSVCERVETAAAMRAALDRQMWDVVIADYSMPHFSAPAALALLQDFSDESGLDLPFIILCRCHAPDQPSYISSPGRGWHCRWYPSLPGVRRGECL